MVILQISLSGVFELLFDREDYALHGNAFVCHLSFFYHQHTQRVQEATEERKEVENPEEEAL